MNYTKTESGLMEAMAEMDIIDCHEHLPPERDRTASPQDVFTLFSHYTRHDLFSAGLDRDADQIGPWDGPRRQYESLFDYNIPLARRWETFKPYWERIRYGSYARAAVLTARMFYGVDDINDATYRELSDRIAEANKPGIYRRILCDTCRIRASLTQGQLAGCELPLVPVMRVTNLCRFQTPDALEQTLGAGIRSLDACVDALEKNIEQGIRDGAVGIKLTAGHNVPPDGTAAEVSLKKLLDGEKLLPDAHGFEPLANYLVHTAIDIASEHKLVVAVHAGVWGDFRQIDCKHMLTLAPAHPRANFDLYHLGMPSVRDAIVIAKNLPNVFLDLCWTHIISQAQACSGIDELLDQVPVNKVLAFGGDYSRPIEKVVGHLHMAREDFARVFASRIDRGLMNFEEAVSILKQWFWDNPLDLYTRLSV